MLRACAAIKRGTQKAIFRGELSRIGEDPPCMYVVAGPALASCLGLNGVGLQGSGDAVNRRNCGILGDAAVDREVASSSRGGIRQAHRAGLLLVLPLKEG